MSDLTPLRLPGGVVVRPVDAGGPMDEWAIFVRGNYIDSFAARGEAERVARDISVELGRG